MFLTNDIPDIYLTPLLANNLLDQRCYGIGRCAASQQRFRPSPVPQKGGQIRVRPPDRALKIRTVRP